MLAIGIYGVVQLRKPAPEEVDAENTETDENHLEEGTTSEDSIAEPGEDTTDFLRRLSEEQ